MEIDGQELILCSARCSGIPPEEGFQLQKLKPIWLHKFCEYQSEAVEIWFLWEQPPQPPLNHQPWSSTKCCLVAEPWCDQHQGLANLFRYPVSCKSNNFNSNNLATNSIYHNYYIEHCICMALIHRQDVCSSFHLHRQHEIPRMIDLENLGYMLQ